RRISVMFSSTSGRSIFGLSTLPRSPPVQVTTRTSTPSATYRAIVAAPLLDSSSGWACTAIRRRPSLTAGLLEAGFPGAERMTTLAHPTDERRRRGTDQLAHERPGLPTGPLRPSARPGTSAPAKARDLGFSGHRGRGRRGDRGQAVQPVR